MPYMPNEPDEGLAAEIGRLLLVPNPRLLRGLDGVTDLSDEPGAPIIAPFPTRDGVLVVWQGRRKDEPRGVALLPAGAEVAYPLVHRNKRTPITGLGGDILDQMEAIAAASGQLGPYARCWAWAGWTAPLVRPGVWEPASSDKYATRIRMTDKAGNVWHAQRWSGGFAVRRPGQITPCCDAAANVLDFRNWTGAMNEAERQAASYAKTRPGKHLARKVTRTNFQARR